MRWLAAALVLAGLAGCQSPPLSPERIAALDYGPRPDDYEKLVRDYLNARLIDPRFALVEIKAGPSPLYQGETLSRERQYGWAVCVMVNDRNDRGGYTGYYPMVFYIREEKIIAADGGNLQRVAGLRYAHAQCKKLGYEIP